MSKVHSQARTTPRTRAEIKASPVPLVELAGRYNISRATAAKWKGRETPQDLSHRPHKLSTTLTPGQEAIVVELRRTVLLPLDDLVAVVREFINPDVSRSGLDRCLRRHGVANLRELQAQARVDAGEVAAPLKTFKDYEPGFLHMDIKYLPQMPDESERRYLFVAIDRATRWVFMRIYADQSEASSVDFLNRLEGTAPMKISKLLTDNGSQFTDRFTSKKREPTGKHKFDVRCKALDIEHRLCPPRHPQTNGMVERFNGRISEVVNQTRFASAAELEATLKSYLKTYNHQIPQRALDHLSPVQALKKWQAEKPDLFVKRVYNQPGLDTYTAAKRATLNSHAWGLGWSRQLTDANGNDQMVYAMIFSDSHRNAEPVVGYAKQWLWNPVGKLKFGAGYTAGITSRADIFENIPFPIALPLLSVGYGRFTVYGTFIPRINSTLNNGNVAFFFAGYAFQ